MSVSEVALWYLRYGHADYELYDSEAEAADAAVAMIEANTAAPTGAQFPDGRLIAREEWPAFAEAEERYQRHQAAWLARKPQPKPVRKAAAPFGGGQIEVDADEPSWLGV